MKKEINKKSLIIIGAVLAIVVVAIVVIALLTTGNKNSNNSGGNDSNVTSFDSQDVEGLNISGFNMLYEGEMTSVLAVVKNTTNNNIAVKKIYVHLYDENGSEIGTTFFYVESELEPGIQNVYSSYISGDVTKAKSVKYEINK